jgi:endonuclease/exonuclease/phosphatase family metal-dependent hydrolase
MGWLTALIGVGVLLCAGWLWAAGPVVRDIESRQGRIWQTTAGSGGIRQRPIDGAAKGEQHAERTDGSPTDPTAITVMTYNVGFASGMANNRPILVDKQTAARNLQAIMSLLAVDQPDIAALQEVDAFARRSFYVDQTRELARAARAPHGAFAPNWNRRYVPFPFWPPSVHYGPVFSGVATLSRYPVVEQEIIPLPQPSSASRLYRSLYLQRVVQKLRIRMPTGRTIVVMNLHLEPFDRANRERHAEIVAELCRDADPLLVMGDCNAPPPYAEKLRDFSADAESQDFTDDRTFEILTSGTGLRSAFDKERYTRHEAAALTFPADGPVVKLDYIFYNRAFELEGATVIRRGSLGSDHLPVGARLVLRDE